MMTFTCFQCPIDFVAARDEACKLLLDKRNFIHTVAHSDAVHSNALRIWDGSCPDGKEEDLVALKLACYWHDTGRNDRDSVEQTPHEVESVRLFSEFARRSGYPQRIVDTVVRAILSHRNRGGRGDGLTDCLSDILWDADKLDIVNPHRVLEILWGFQAGYSAGEFSWRSSLDYWKGISVKFVERLHFDESRRLFLERYDGFSELIVQMEAFLASNHEFVARTSRVPNREGII